MNKEEMQNNYIEMLIQDLEKHSFEYWESTQDEMIEALRNLQQKVNQLEEENKELQENYKAILKQRDDITKNATETIEKYQQENKQLKANRDEAIELIDLESSKRKSIMALHTQFVLIDLKSKLERGKE